MNVHLNPLDVNQLLGLLAVSHKYSTRHNLIYEPEAADLILLVGSFGLFPDRLLHHPLYKAFPDRCAVYTEGDYYLPLAPGIYTHAHNDEHTRVGRIFGHCYLSRHGVFKNNSVADGHRLVAAKPVERRKYLFSFQGSSSALLRKRMFKLNFKRPDVLIENTSAYQHWEHSQTGRETWQRSYVDTLANSAFALCPRGAGIGSVRLFEVMELGLAPVLIADGYHLPIGPAWDKFLIVVQERDIGRLPEILEPLRGTAAERGRLAREAFLEHFSTEREFDRIVELAARSLHHGGPAEAVFRDRQAAMIQRGRLRRAARARLRAAALRTMSLLRIPNPYAMNRQR